jgi:cytochrome c oxidase subunit II
VHQIVGEPPPSKKRSRQIIGATIGAVTASIVLLAVVLTRDRLLDEPPTRRSPIVSVDVLTEGQSWRFEYPQYGVSVSDGSPEIVLPAGSRVRFTLRSADVIHSMWVPQLWPKRDIVPGRTNELLIHVASPGTCTGTDAEYAGIKYMLPDFQVRVVTVSEFVRWVAGGRSAASLTAA